MGAILKQSQSRASTQMGLSESSPTRELIENPRTSELQARGVQDTVDQSKKSPAIFL